MVMADFNAHVRYNSLDFIVHDDLDDHVPLPSDIYCPDIPLTRNTMELRKLNPNGESLIDMCKSVSVRIVNGRVAGDNCGQFTSSPIYDSANYQQSVLDYALSDTAFLPKIKYFSVSDLTRFSDHCGIMLSIQTNFSVRNIDTNDPHLTLSPTKSVWKNHYKIVLDNIFKSENCQQTSISFVNRYMIRTRLELILLPNI